MNPVEDAQVIVACPYCGGHIQFSSQFLGMVETCPHCSKDITLSDASTIPQVNQPSSVVPEHRSRSKRVWRQVAILALLVPVCTLAVYVGFRTPNLAQTVMSVVMLLATLVFVGGIYFLPAIVAKKKRCYNSVLVVNFFLGWTLIGWVVALAWATYPEKEEH
jgi:hypothetical protein